MLMLYADENECARHDRGGCQHHCINTEGSFFCTCQVGYVLEDNERNCKGI